MSQSLRTTVYFTVLLICGYICFAFFIARAVDNLNLAREDELKAVTVRQSLLRRLSKESLARIMGQQTPKNNRQESEFSFPMSASVTSGFPEQSSPETSPNYASVATRHFKIFSYNRELLEYVGARIEKYYENVISDTGFTENVTPQDRIRVDILRDQEEYTKKTGRPAWSSGTADISNSTLCTYEGVHINRTIPRQLTHLIVDKYLGQKADGDDARWVSEGLAVYEAMKADENNNRALITYLKEKLNDWRGQTAAEFMLMRLDEHTPSDAVALWYARAGSLVEFLMEQKGGASFTGFLRAIKSSGTAKEALASSYAGVFKDIEDLNNRFIEYVGNTIP